MSDKRRSEYFTFEERIGLVETIKKTIDEIELKKVTPLRIKKNNWLAELVWFDCVNWLWSDVEGNGGQLPGDTEK